MVVPCNDVVYLRGLLATELASMTITNQNLLPETVPVAWQPASPVAVLPVTRVFQLLPL